MFALKWQKPKELDLALLGWRENTNWQEMGFLFGKLLGKWFLSRTFLETHRYGIFTLVSCQLASVNTALSWMLMCTTVGEFSFAEMVLWNRKLFNKIQIVVNNVPAKFTTTICKTETRSRMETCCSDIQVIVLAFGCTGSPPPPEKRADHQTGSSSIVDGVGICALNVCVCVAFNMQPRVKGLRQNCKMPPFLSMSSLFGLDSNDPNVASAGDGSLFSTCHNVLFSVHHFVWQLDKK